MDKNSLKKVIKPLIKECLTEILYEQGLNKLIEESIKAKSTEIVKENKQQEEKQTYEAKEVKFMKQAVQSKPNKIQEAKKMLLEKIGKNGFDPFAGTVPLEGSSEEQTIQGLNPQATVMPGIQGSGVDISGLIGQNKHIWKDVSAALKKGKKE